MTMWKATVVWAALAGLAAGETWLSNITDHFREGTSNVMRMSEVNYTKHVVNVTYVARVELDMRAMGHLYNSTHTIIDFIANKQAYPEGLCNTRYDHGRLITRFGLQHPLLAPKPIFDYQVDMRNSTCVTWLMYR